MGPKMIFELSRIGSLGYLKQKHIFFPVFNQLIITSNIGVLGQHGDGW